MVSKSLYIKDVCSRFSSGKSISASKIKKTGKYPVYGGNGIRGYTDTYNFDGECAVIGRQGAYCGNVRYFSGKGYMTEHAVVAVANQNNNTRFLAYKFALMNLGRYVGQSAQPGLSVETLLDVHIDVPSKPIQDNIANVLSTIDSQIENNNAICSNLEGMVKLLYDYWFVQFDFPDENGKPYKSSGGNMVWNEKLKREIPAGWEVSKINSLLGKYPKTKSVIRNDYGGGVRFPIIDQSKDYICGYTDDESKVLHMSSAIVFGDHTNVVKYVNFDFARGAEGTQIINSNDVRIPNYLLYLQIQNLPVIEKGYSRHYKFLKEQNVIVPDETVSKKYMSIISDSLLRRRSIIEENWQLRSLRDFLLPMLMNGQITVGKADK